MTAMPEEAFEWRYWVEPTEDPGTEEPAETVLYDYAAEALALNPDAYYRLGEQAGAVMGDSSPGGRHGTYNGAVALAQAGLLTNDDNDAITLPGVATAYGAVPYAAWMNRAVTASAGGIGFGVWFSSAAAVTQYLIQRWGNVGTAQVFGLDLFGTNQVRAYVRVAGGNTILTVTNATARNGQRHFLFASLSGGVLTLYLDGVPIGTLAAAGTLATSTTEGIQLGRRSDATGPLNGKLDEVWVGPALSAEQVLYLYQIGTTGAPEVPGDILVPYGAEWAYRQTTASDATNYSVAVSGWTAGGEAPFGANRAGIATAWAPESRLWVQRTLPPLDTLAVTLRVEDNATIYVNGTLAGSTGVAGAGASHLTPTTFPVDPSLLHDDAPNLVAIRADDEYGGAGAGGVEDQTFLDVQLTGTLTAVAPVSGGWTTHPERSHALAALSVVYGRSDAHSRCRPLQATAVLASPLSGACPPSGERFRLTLSDAAATALGLTEEEAALFTGEVTDPEVDPATRVYDITGVGRLGRASRRTLRTADWATELDGARVARVLPLADLDAGTIDPGTADLIPPDGNASVGNLLETVTDSTGGSLVEQPDGTIDYHDAEHRRGTPVTVTLTAGQIDNRLTWRQRVDDLLNELTVAWAGGTVLAEDAGSVRTRGSFPGQITTALATASDAHSLGQRIVARRSEPVWQLPNLEVDLMRMVDGALRAQLLGLRHGDRILVTGIPTAHPYTGDVEFFVEGWTMRLDRPILDQPWRWKLTLAVSDPTFSGVSLRWIDLPVGLAWDELDVGMSWLDLARVEDPADL